MDYLRLRQICLVAPTLEPVVSDLAAILGLRVCYRDPHVGAYGLENALLPVGQILLEVVAPTQSGTAAGRFIDRSSGRGGYMAIFCCADPDARAALANAIGVRTAHTIDHPPYRGVQLHPRDCRAAFIELNHTDGTDDTLTAYPPAGPDWLAAIRDDVTLALTDVTFESTQPHDLAAHWGNILQLPATADATIDLPNARLSFTQGASEAMTALTLRVRNPDIVAANAQARHYDVADSAFTIGGVAIRLVA